MWSDAVDLGLAAGRRRRSGREVVSAKRAITERVMRCPRTATAPSARTPVLVGDRSRHDDDVLVGRGRGFFLVGHVSILVLRSAA